MSYSDVLKLLEKTLEDANSLEKEFDQSKSAMENFEVTRKEAHKSGLSFSDALYNEAKEKFDSGDYEGATVIAVSSSDKLESCNSRFETLNNLFEVLGTFDMKHTLEFDSLKEQLDEYMDTGDFDKAGKFCELHELGVSQSLTLPVRVSIIQMTKAGDSAVFFK